MDWDGLVPVMHDCVRFYLLMVILREIILTAISAEQELKYCTQVLCFDSLIVAPVPESPDTSPSKAGSKGIKMNTRNVSLVLWACNSNSIMELWNSCWDISSKLVHLAKIHRCFYPYLIFVTGATGRGRVNFFARCKFLQI